MYTHIRVHTYLYIYITVIINNDKNDCNNNINDDKPDW